MDNRAVRYRGLDSGWRRTIRRRWGIQVLTSGMKADGELWCTRCAPVKGAESGPPEVLYASRLLTRFFHFVKARGYRYGVLSDLYGLHLDVEHLDGYDVHPSSLDEQQKAELGVLIGQKTRALGLERIIFYNSSPLRSVPYFEMLAASGLTAWYTTRLPDN